MLCKFLCLSMLKHSLSEKINNKNLTWEYVFTIDNGKKFSGITARFIKLYNIKNWTFQKNIESVLEYIKKYKNNWRSHVQ